LENYRPKILKFVSIIPNKIQLWNADSPISLFFDKLFRRTETTRRIEREQINTPLGNIKEQIKFFYRNLISVAQTTTAITNSLGAVLF